MENESTATAAPQRKGRVTIESLKAELAAQTDIAQSLRIDLDAANISLDGYRQDLQGCEALAQRLVKVITGKDEEIAFLRRVLENLTKAVN